VGGFGDDYVSSARELLSTWINEPDTLDPAALKPYQNAENIAAAATGKSLAIRRSDGMKLIVSQSTTLPRTAASPRSICDDHSLR
jgi:hypothetical protein